MSSATFVVTSEVTVDPQSAGTLEAAFQDRVRLVEAATGFQRIEVWRDGVRPGVFQMVSWWDSAEDFRAYMRSDDHRTSHARIPVPPHKPRGTGVRRYELVPDLGPCAGAAAAEPLLRCPAGPGGPA